MKSSINTPFELLFIFNYLAGNFVITTVPVSFHVVIIRKFLQLGSTLLCGVSLGLGYEIRKKFGVDSRIVMTFYQGKFLYTERAVNIMMCSTFKDCSYVYSVKAWFFTTYFPPLID